MESDQKNKQIHLRWALLSAILILTMLVSALMSSAPRIEPVGLCGELRKRSLVFGVSESRTWSQSIVYPG